MVEDEENLKIYDAKYYDLDENTPSANDVVKQIAYKKAYELEKYNVVLNAFVFPSLECEDFERVGKVEFLNDSVKIYTLNPKNAYKAYK